MDGITTGTRPESRGPDFVIGITCPSRIISIPCRSNQGERLDSKTRNYGVHTTKTRLGESRALLFFFLSDYRILRTLVRLLSVLTSPSSSPTPPTPACSFPAHGSWKNYACRETTSFLCPAVNEVVKSTVRSSFIVTVTPSCTTPHKDGRSGSTRASQVPWWGNPLISTAENNDHGMGGVRVRDRVLPGRFDITRRTSYERARLGTFLPIYHDDIKRKIVRREYSPCMNPHLMMSLKVSQSSAKRPGQLRQTSKVCRDAEQSAG
jgi:hypothetical protein